MNWANPRYADAAQAWSQVLDDHWRAAGVPAWVDERLAVDVTHAVAVFCAREIGPRALRVEDMDRMLRRAAEAARAALPEVECRARRLEERGVLTAGDAQWSVRLRALFAAEPMLGELAVYPALVAMMRLAAALAAVRPAPRAIGLADGTWLLHRLHGGALSPSAAREARERLCRYCHDALAAAWPPAQGAPPPVEWRDLIV